jgi:signal transduction histidine kinase
MLSSWKEGEHMLHDFVRANRAEIIARCRAKISTRPVPRPTDVELEHGVPLFLDQLAHSLHIAFATNPAIATTAAENAAALLHEGFTIAQVVHNYGGICQTITEMAGETDLSITAIEFRTLNLCLDDAIAGAVSEYSRLREYEGTERLGHLAHELRNLLNSAVLSYDMLKAGTVGIGGSTGAVLGRSLVGLQSLVDRELAEVRLGAGIHHRETVVVRDFLEDVEAAAVLEANARGVQFSVVSVSADVTVHVDRQILASVMANLLQNAFKFTRASGQVSLHAHATSDRVFLDVADQCGGLPPGKLTDMFGPFRQLGRDRTGLGLGLSVCDRGARVNGGEIRVRNEPGSGCIFTVDLPRQRPVAFS